MDHVHICGDVHLNKLLTLRRPLQPTQVDFKAYGLDVHTQKDTHKCCQGFNTFNAVEGKYTGEYCQILCIENRGLFDLMLPGLQAKLASLNVPNSSMSIIDCDARLPIQLGVEQAKTDNRTYRASQEGAE
jgi:hypothetical protein